MRMKNKLLSKILAIGIIILFIGVGIHPAFAVDTKQSIRFNQSEKCRECSEISDADLVKVESLLNRVGVYSKLLLVLSRYNPELREISEDLSYLISTFKKSDLKDIICDWLFNIINSLYTIIMDLVERASDGWDAGVSTGEIFRDCLRKNKQSKNKAQILLTKNFFFVQNSNLARLFLFYICDRAKNFLRVERGVCPK